MAVGNPEGDTTMQHHYVITYNSNIGEWEMDSETEAIHFLDGTIYDDETDTWHRDYLGDGVFTPEAERLGVIISKAIEELNKGIK